MKLRKKLEEKFFHMLSAVTTLIIILILLQLLWSIIDKGAMYLSWDILSQSPRGSFYLGGGGGFLNAIAGSFYLASGATILAICISVPVALFLNVYLVKYPRLVLGVRFFLDVMWGIPSIVYGAFGFLIMMYLGYRNSLGAGILTLSAVICPIMIRAMDEVLKTIPVGLQEAAYAIGSNKTETAFKVYLRKAFPGLVTAVLLAFSRGIGDAASVLFTAGYTDNVPTKLSDPAASLPLTIYYQFQSNSEDLQNLAYTAAILLTGIVLATSVTARLLYSKK